MLAIALDLLAQTEAQHRAARRLEASTHLLVTRIRDRGTVDEHQARQLRDHIDAVRDIAEVHRNLIADFHRELAALAGSRT